MLDLGEDKLCWSIQHHLGALEISEEPEKIEFIRQILNRNLSNGRLQRVLSKSDCNVENYVTRVVNSVSRWQIYLYELQIEKSEEAWQDLLPKLRQWASALYLKWGAFLDHERSTQAHYSSVDGAMEILKSDFPYDVDFYPWAYALQRNTCCRHVREASKKANGSGIKILELDAWDRWEQNLPDPNLKPIDTDISLQEIRRELLISLEQLAISQQSFVKFYYFEELSYSEIMCKLDRSKNALYSLHHNALKNLRNLVENQL